MTDAELNAHFGGGFFHHTAGERTRARLFAPRTGSAILLDGSQCAHGTELYKAGDKHLQLPMTDKTDQRALEYVPASNKHNEQWQLRVNGKVIKEYPMSDLRIALVWRSKCFASEQELAKYKQAPRLKVLKCLKRRSCHDRIHIETPVARAALHLVWVAVPLDSFDRHCL